MSRKFLRKYNKETHEWELVSAPDISIDARLPEGSEITDNNVRITNENYSGDTTLNDALDTINNDITRLQRNVSWLDSHKGEGGGGGGGSQSYKIVISSPSIEDGNKVFAKSDTIDVEFMITGPDTDESCQYSYSFDNYTSGFSPILPNTYQKIKGLSIVNNTHSFTLKAKNPYGVNVTSVSFNIYKSNIGLIFDIERAGSSYQEGIFYVKTNQTTADIPLILDNGMEGAEVTISASVPGQETKTKKILSASAGKTRQVFDFWDIVEKGGGIIGNYFVVTFKAIAVFGGQVLDSVPFSIVVRVINSDEVSIVMGVNGSGRTEEAISINLDSVMRYNFKVYAPISINRVYYAAKLSKEGGEDILLIGNYYSDELHKEGYNSYDKNDTLGIDTTLSLSYYISEDAGFVENDVLYLSIKVWDNVAGTPVEAYQKILLSEADTRIFGRQIPSRSDGSGKKDTVFAFWDATNANPDNRNRWSSNVTGYSYIDSSLIPVYGTNVNTFLDVYDGNNSSGIITDGAVPYLRLQNHAYAVCDLSDYYSEIQQFTSNRILNNSFIISLTFLTDNTTNENKTIFLWGDNNVNGELSNGIRVDANGVYWKLKTWDSQPLLSCKLTRGNKKTIDFVYEKTDTKSIAKIYIDGILNAAKDFSIFDNEVYFPSKIYFGGNVVNGEITNFSNINVYDFSIYSKSLNDLQLIVNGKRAKLDGSPSDPSVLADYNIWKAKNFITDKNNLPDSSFFNSSNNEYRLDFDWDQARNVAVSSDIPTLILNFNNTQFTKEYFYNTTHQTSSDTFNCVASYYDPNTLKWIDNFNVRVSLQGTTTLQYRMKNLEMYMADYISIGGVQMPKLFQPREDWFPESQFTLKADVVDSAHANNAVLGQWINNCSILEANPAMSNLNADTRPKDVNNNGVVQEHLDKDGHLINYHENVTIKHTLEGFPILLFVQFAEETKYSFLGIYSFNLGRYSYYNMGLKFLDSFSKRDDSGSIVACPKIIDYYTTKETLGSVNANNCYSFEFGNEGDQSTPPVWTQDDLSIIRRYGEFKSDVPVDYSNPIWDKLKELFTSTATSPISQYGNDFYHGFDNMNIYTIDPDTQQYKNTGVEYNQTVDSYDVFSSKINLNNAAAYFIIANAFGMTDSLGKNMVLRTWDDGKTWWTCFYDMDTALGLSNNGSEDVSVTVLIDTISMIVDSADSTTKIVRDYHSNTAFAGYKSKLWGLLRDKGFIYAERGANSDPWYDELWNTLRQSNGDLSYANNFVEKMRQRIGTCGEIIYNCDYTQKYISTGDGDSSGTPTSFLHGTRIEYVNEWLKKHFYFLDGVFNAKNLNNTYDFTSTDNVLNNRALVIGLRSESTSTVVPFSVRVATPTFIGMTVGNDKQTTLYYIDNVNEDTTIYYPNEFNKDAAQATIYGVSLITKFDGIQGMFTKITDTNDNQGVCSLFSGFDVSGSRRLADNSLKTNVFVTSEGESALETINLSNVGFKADTEVQEYEVNLSDLNNLLNVNISNSDVTNIILPNSSLRTLSVKGSKINAFRLIDQNRISSIDLGGCSKLNTIVISRCPAMQELVISDLNVLTTLEISDCASLSSVTIYNCNSLSSITITDNSNLERLDISEILTNGDLIIKVLGGVLSAVTITETNCTKITLPSEANLSYLKTLDLSNNIYLERIAIGNEEPEYLDEPLFDFSRMPSLRSFSLRNVYKVKYLRLQNIENAPFELSEDSLYGCTGIERILGHFRVTKSSMFNGLVNFRINDWDKPYEEYTASEWQGIWNSSIFDFNSGNTATNITFGEPTATTINLQLCFSNTLCDVLDVIYVFKRLNAKITNINSIFRNCGAILTDFEKSLPTELFSNCTGVKSAFGVFYGCNGINTEISSQMLAPIMGQSGITEFDSVFVGTNVYVKYNEVLFPSGNAITFINNFNPVYYYDVIDEKPQPFDVNPLNVLSNLTSLIRISNSFDNIIFSGDGAGDEFKLFYGITNLKIIYNSFNHFVCEVYNSSGAYVKNILGKATNDYPQLTIVTGSFNVDGENQSVSIYIGNTFFGNSNATLQNFSSNFDEVYKYIDFNDCGGFTFPYKILKGCVNLEKCGGLFKEVECLYNNAVNTGITLPNYVDESGNTISMFEDCVALKEIPAFFSGMTNVNYTLSGNGFKNCQLEDVSNIFDNTGYKALKSGIPLKLFYQCDEDGCVRNTIKNMSSAFRGCNSSECTCYTFDGLDSDLYENYRDENNVLKLRWNIYAFDGTRDFCTREFNTSGGTKVTLADIEAAHPELGSIPAEFSQGYVSGTPFEYIQNKDDLGYEYTIDEINEIFAIDNYFCPPDIFKYCANDGNTAIDGVFYDTSSVIGGLHGKIPEFLFRPITNIMSLSQVFYGCTLLLPYEWGRKNSETEEITYGKRYPSELFSGLSNLRDLSRTFMSNKIYGKTEINLSEIPATINSLSGVFERTDFVKNSRVVGDLYRLKSLLDISVFFAFSNVADIPLSPFITPLQNPSISQCSGFMRNCQGITNIGMVPEIWNYNYSNTSQYTAAFYGVNQTLRASLEEIARTTGNRYIERMLRLN